MIGKNSPSTGMFVFLFFQISRFNPLKSHNFAFSLPLDSFGVGGDWGIEGTTLQSVER
jgi:hypothetical protein